MKPTITEIQTILSSHKVGMKRVLLAAEESGCAIMQIAVTDLKVGKVAEAHGHTDMQEVFCVMSGELNMDQDGVMAHCKAEDFVWMRCGVIQELKVIIDTRIMTIGCLAEKRR